MLPFPLLGGYLTSKVLVDCISDKDHTPVARH